VIFVGLLLAAAVVVLVALPFLREPVTADDRLDAPS
jgi:predicted outer membrane lipoprotein